MWQKRRVENDNRHANPENDSRHTNLENGIRQTNLANVLLFDVVYLANHELSWGKKRKKVTEKAARNTSNKKYNRRGKKEASKQK